MANEGMTYGSFMMSPLNVTGNYTSYIKNFSHNVYYGINVSGTKFNLYPESGLNPMIVAPGDGGTIVVGAFAADMMNIRNIRMNIPMGVFIEQVRWHTIIMVIIIMFM